MQSPDTDDAPIVPYTPARPTEETTTEPPSMSDLPPFDRPPETDHTTPYTRDNQEIEPFVEDLR